MGQSVKLKKYLSGFQIPINGRGKNPGKATLGHVKVKVVTVVWRKSSVHSIMRC